MVTPVLSTVIFLPAATALVLAAWPHLPDRLVKVVWVAASAVEFGLTIALWIGYAAGNGVTGGFAYVTEVRWIPALDSGYHIGLDGLSLPLVAVTALLFLACAIYGLRERRRVRSYACLFLFLETTGIGLFSSLDLLLFFVFFDLSLVAMYFVIAGWGHAGARHAATKFFLYTFVGSLALLLGFIGLFLASEPHTFDIVTLARTTPLAGHALGGGLVLLALSLGLAVKTPVFPLHTWLPLAHTEAPAPGSAILAGVLLKMGTYGFLRIVMPALPGAWRQYALVFVIVGVIGVLYGALVALAQQDFKRMIAYTSVNHMGYIILAIGAAGLVADNSAQARALAVTGAVTQMVSHALVTGALFLLAGVLHDRGGTYRMDAYGGLAAPAPAFAGITAIAAFASLGLPGLSGFVAEFQIFTGSVPVAPVATGFAILGIVLTAALLLWALQRVFLGGRRAPVTVIAEIHVSEAVAIVPLLAASIAIGVAPRFLLGVIEPAARTVAGLLGAV